MIDERMRNRNFWRMKIFYGQEGSTDDDDDDENEIFESTRKAQSC